MFVLKNFLVFFLIFCFLFLSSDNIAFAQTIQLEPLLILIGDNYINSYPSIIGLIVSRSDNDAIKVLVLPVGYPSISENISEFEKQKSISAAESQRSVIQKYCDQVISIKQTCTVFIVPVYTHIEALQTDISGYFTNDLTALFILGNNPEVGRQIIQNTPIVDALASAYQRGVLVAGGSALSSTMPLFILSDKQTPTPTNTQIPPSPTLESTSQPKVTSTKPPKPTPTPLKVPPPADPEVTNMIIGFGVLGVVVVIFGLVLNWRQIIRPKLNK